MAKEIYQGQKLSKNIVAVLKIEAFNNLWCFVSSMELFLISDVSLLFFSFSGRKKKVTWFKALGHKRPISDRHERYKIVLYFSETNLIKREKIKRIKKITNIVL